MANIEPLPEGIASCIDLPLFFNVRRQSLKSIAPKLAKAEYSHKE